MDAVAVLFKPFEEEPLLEAIGRAIALPHEIDLTYKNGTRSARFGPPVMLPGPAVNSMVGYSEEENGRAVVATAPPTEVRSLEVVDFEKLLADLSTTFVRASVEDIDSEIEKCLHRIVLAMNIDRSTVVQVDPADGLIYTTHQWARDPFDAPDSGHRVNDTGSYPWLTGKVLSGEAVVIPRLEDIPPEGSKDRDSFRRDGNKSNEIGRAHV